MKSPLTSHYKPTSTSAPVLPLFLLLVLEKSSLLPQTNPSTYTPDPSPSHVLLLLLSLPLISHQPLNKLRSLSPPNTPPPAHLDLVTEAVSSPSLIDLSHQSTEVALPEATNNPHACHEPKASGFILSLPHLSVRSPGTLPSSQKLLPCLPSLQPLPGFLLPPRPLLLSLCQHNPLCAALSCGSVLELHPGPSCPQHPSQLASLHGQLPISM